MYRIVCIEDSPTMRKLLQKTLAGEGYECLVAGTLAQGLKVCNEDKPDLIVLDVNLPDGNGIDLCRQIKENQRLAHIPIVILTGEAFSVENRVEGIEAGTDVYVIKRNNMK